MKKTLAALFVLLFLFPVLAFAQDDDNTDNPTPTPQPTRSSFLKRHASSKINAKTSNDENANGSLSGGSPLGPIPIADDTLRWSVSLDAGSGSMPIPAFTDQDGNFQPAYTITSMDYVAQSGLEKILGKFSVGTMGWEVGLKGKASVALEYWGTQQGPGEPGDYFCTTGFPDISNLHAGDEIDIHGFWWALSPEVTAHTELSPNFEFGLAVGFSTYGHLAMSIQDPWTGSSYQISDAWDVNHSKFLTDHLPSFGVAPDWSMNMVFIPTPSSQARYYLEMGMTGPDWIMGAGMEFLLLPDIIGVNPPAGQPTPAPGPKAKNPKKKKNKTAPTPVPTNTPTDTPTDTWTALPTATWTVTDTATPVPAKRAPTPVPTHVPSPAATAKATSTPSTPSPEATTVSNPNGPLPSFVISLHGGDGFPLSQGLQNFTGGGPAVGAKLGLDVSPQWTLGLNFDYQDQFGQEVMNNGNGYTPPDSIHIPIEFFTQYHLDLGSRFFRPYLQLGLGVAIDSQGGTYTDYVNGSAQTATIPKKTWINPEVDPALGFEFNFSDNFGVYVEGALGLDFGPAEEFNDKPIILIPAEMGLSLRL